MPKIIWYLDDPVADPAPHTLVLRRRRGPASASRWSSPERAPTSSSAATPSTRSPCRSRSVRQGAYSPIKKVLNKLGQSLARGPSRGKSLARCAAPTPDGGALLRQRPVLQLRAARAGRPEDRPAGVGPTREVTAPIYAESEDSSTRLSRMQHLDLFTWMRGDILVKADKITMAEIPGAACAVPGQGGLRRRPGRFPTT